MVHLGRSTCHAISGHLLSSQARNLGGVGLLLAAAKLFPHMHYANLLATQV